MAKRHFESDRESDSDASLPPLALSDSDASDAYTSDAFTSDTASEPARDARDGAKRPEIDPHYSSDDSDGEEVNPIGNIPISAYDRYPHIGYSIDGKRIMRPATKSAIDALLEQIDLPKGWTGLIDKKTGEGLNLSKEELELVNRVQQGLLPSDSINPFEDQLEWFSTEVENAPLSARNEPKRRFAQSKHEARQVMKLVRAMREGKLVYKPLDLSVDDDDRMMQLSTKLYDVWQTEEPSHNAMHLPAPKLPPPTHEESYNPPKEYLLTEEEKAKWEQTDPEDRELDFVPQSFGALRKVPGYANALRERFERCLDLYLAPRARDKRTRVDPDSLIPDLPSPDSLKPFPITQATVYTGHDGKVRTLAVDASGSFLATGGDDGTVRVWDVLTGRELYRLDLALDKYDAARARERTPVDSVRWHPTLPLLAVAAGDSIFLAVPPPVPAADKAHELLEKGWSFHQGEQLDTTHAEWAHAPPALAAAGCTLVVRCRAPVRRVDWHARGDYFVTTQPSGGHAAVLVHQLSKHRTQSPFRRSRGIVQSVQFHPFKPHLYVASQRYVRIYNLANQTLLKRLLPGVKWLADFAIHPQGENVLVCSYDLRVAWHDLALSDRPYKTLRYHDRAVRDVAFHPSLPLFCSAADDGTVHVLHATVYDDSTKNPLLVPLKILRGHRVQGGLGVLEAAWHPREAWLFTAGGDGTARLWTT